MKRTLTTIILAGWTGLALAGSAAAARLPQTGSFTEADLARAQAQSTSIRPADGHGWEDQDAIRAERASLVQTQKLNSTDDDACHYARGSVAIVHIFVSHTGASWTAQQRADAGAKAATAKQYYLDNAPAGANLSFDNPGSNTYFFYAVTLNQFIPTSGMSSDLMETVLGALGWSDGDGDGWIVDDLSLYLQSWGGGWDNVILCFEAATTGRAWASYAFARTALYQDDSANVFAHEWGHLFGACDEYVENGACNTDMNCGACQSTYLDETINNGNCGLMACGTQVPCLMNDNTFGGICSFTRNHWGWVDEDSNGLLDEVRRRTTGTSFVNIWEIPHNGNALWNVTTDGYVIAQRWNTWCAAGLRSPSDADYNLRLYGDNNHNYLLASSNQTGQTVDLIVADFNHNQSGNEHLQVNRASGSSSNYRLHWESGTGMAYPDGVVRTYAWEGYFVVKTWDVPLFAGETLTFRANVESGSMDLGMALFRSNGAAYFAGRSAAQWVRDASGAGVDEVYSWTVPADDVYGLVVFANNSSSGQISIQIGPSIVALSEEVPFNSSWDLRLFSYAPNAFFWSIAGTRPETGTNVTLRLFDDAGYQSELETSANYGGIEFVAADYNAGYTAADYLRIIRESGSGNHRTMWEHDADINPGYVFDNWTSGHVGKIWDVYLRGGQSYFFREYHSGSVDTGIYVYSSADGDRYKRRNAYAAGSNSRPASDGGEWFSYQASANDWYGLAVIVNDESAGSYSMWQGPRDVLPNGGSVTYAEEVVFPQATVPSGYWTAFGVRTRGSDQAVLWLHDESSCATSSAVAAEFFTAPVSFVVGDFNHMSTATYYPRVRRGAGSNSIDVGWEGGNETIVYTPGQPNQVDLLWNGNDIVQVIDLYVPGAGGQTVTVAVDVLTGGLDPGVALFASSGAAYWGGLASAAAAADQGGSGQTETLTYTFQANDWFGLVIYNKNTNSGTMRIRLSDPTTVAVEPAAEVVWDLQAASTNPFRTTAALSYALPSEGLADLAIFDVAGRLVRQLVEGSMAAGRHAARWDGRDAAGAQVPAGVYFARLKQGGNERIVKLVRSTSGGS